jgi:M6 family metalloprotease-like protein
LPVAGEGMAPPASIAGLGPGAFHGLEFSRAWLRKAEDVRRRREELQVAGLLDGMTPEQLAAAGAALTGTLRIPVIPITYYDVPVPFAAEELHQRLFGEPRGDTLSFAAYWAEVSGGLLRIEGVVTPWVRLPRPARHYLPAEHFGWGRFGRITEVREDALRAVRRHVDFGEFDNDGGDDRPNSGDDDGYVDFVAFVYATACPGDGRAGAIWPHRGAMEPVATGATSPDGRPIAVADYVVLPAVNPGTCGVMHIGVLAHEIGHALGLPDLYDYDGSSQGIGAWGLMGSGSHAEPFSPAHLSAWEKEQLGWVEVRWLREGGPLVVQPVQESRTVYRFDLPGSDGQYLLLENRQRTGSDRYLPGSGMLLWRIAPERGELGTWNRDERRPAVQLVQADGRHDLERGRQADAGDPFPGSARRRRVELPGAGFALHAIGARGADVVARVGLGHADAELVAETEQLWFSAPLSGGAVHQWVQVRPEGGASESWLASSGASWLRLARDGDHVLVSADPAGLAAGAYVDSVELVPTGGRGGRSTVAVRLNVVAPGTPEVIAQDLLWSWGLAVSGERVYQASYGWDPLGLRPRPRLLHFRNGDAHPQTLSRLPADALYAPVVSRAGSVYVLARARQENFLYQVHEDGGATLVARGIGEGPAYGATMLPDGSILVADWGGVLTQVVPGSPSVSQVWARLNGRIYQIAADAEGRVYATTYRGEVLRVEASGRVTAHPTGFEPGRLVAVAAGPDGAVYAAERGGSGRIVRLRGEVQLPEEIVRVAGGEFYGLAVDGEFLYALDLGNRQLLRMPLPRPELPGTVVLSPVAPDDGSGGAGARD